jgi:hypothetical protein
MFVTLVGMACVAYTALEIGRAWRRPPPALFGAVDAQSGRPLDVTLDRRARGRRASDR